jgi:N12 class adenine-specific DNA methylase
MIHIRDTVHKLMRLQLYHGTDDEIKAKQAELNSIYDSFSADSSYYLLSSLEILDDDGNFIRKSDMFSKRTILNKRQVDRVDSASEALAISIGEHAVVDMPLMERLTGKDEATLFAELTGVIFKDFYNFPDGDFRYVTTDEFLSGNVREKLENYRIGLTLTPENNENYEAVKTAFSALESAQPKDLDASEIEFRLGSTWIPQEYVEQFMYEILQTAYYSRKDYRVYYHNVTGEWQITGKKRALYSDIAATVTYGTKRVNAYEIIDDTCNLRDVRVYDHIEDEETRRRLQLRRDFGTIIG